MESTFSRYQPGASQLIDEDGRKLVRERTLHPWGIARGFVEIEEMFFAMGILHRGQIGAAKTLIVESRPMLDFTIDLLRKDPWSLAKREEQQFPC